MPRGRLSQIYERFFASTALQLFLLSSGWTGPDERATLMSISFAGIPTATVTIFPLTSWLCQSGVDGGWPMAFYVPGTTGFS